MDSFPGGYLNIFPHLSFEQVDQLFLAQLFHDRKQYEERRRMSPEDRAKTPVVDSLMLGVQQRGDAGCSYRAWWSCVWE